MLKLQYWKEVDEKTRAMVDDAARRIASVVDLRHDIPVWVTPTVAVTDTRGGFGFAAFAPDEHGPRIFLGGLTPDDIAPDEAADYFAHNLAHEVAHYEQWRDGLPMIEDGVDERADAILRAATDAATSGEEE